MGLTPHPEFRRGRTPHSSKGGSDAEAGAAVPKVSVGSAMDLLPGSPGGVCPPALLFGAAPPPSPWGFFLGLVILLLNRCSCTALGGKIQPRIERTGHFLQGRGV